ncbi:iron(III) transport system ATP-binding protein [Clostridium collagenovorans DSM 3089]|uniref:ABC-type quaternary amine transporter n=1 Tax=Clostridium collagenovorans DSM 3089 TaxID=1121306 RepID=A0A1M5X8N5_9CLOT|nr:ABC transporter ATP-binding protein [Clostridium collagenovorans]SHH96190.1 iron(III) transport system ATP-binding protein [Clostridium collagenovorans DSM 3089]
MYLQIDKLSKKFNDKVVLDNLTLSINQGEILCLLGPSGCGKTTALKLVGGFLKEDCGNVTIDGEDIMALPPEKRPVSTVFQSYALFPHMTVLENVIYGLKFKGYKKKEAIKEGEKYLEIVDLLSHKNKKIAELSGGQQQRVALIRALIVKPKVLLLDEPLSNLDAKLRVKMREEIKSIQKQFNTTMIFVTHDQEEALSIADKIAVMNKGKLEQLGTPEEIYNSPVNNFVLDFIGNSNVIKDDEGKNIFIRPEHIIMSKEDGDLLGNIVSRVFMGSYITYIVNTEKGTLNVKESNLNGDIYSINEEVHLKIIKEGII